MLISQQRETKILFRIITILLQIQSANKSKIAKQKVIEYLKFNCDEKVISSVELSKQLNIDSKRCSDFLQFLEVVHWIQFEGRKYRLFTNKQLYSQILKFENDIKIHKLYDEDINKISFKLLALDVLHILYQSNKKMSVKQLANELKKDTLCTRITEIIISAKFCGYLIEDQKLYHWNQDFFNKIKKEQEQQIYGSKTLYSNSYEGDNPAVVAVFSPPNNRGFSDLNRSQLSQQLSLWLLSQDGIMIDSQQ